MNIEKIGEQRGSSKKAENDYEKTIANNPPEDFELFKEQFKFHYSENLDSRVIAVIAGAFRIIINLIMSLCWLTVDIALNGSLRSILSLLTKIIKPIIL